MPRYADYSDRELAILLRQGDELAFAEIYDHFKGLLFVHAYKRLNSQQEAEDVLHDLFATLWNKRTELTIESNLSAYLYTAIRNRIFKLISHKKITTAYLAVSQISADKGYSATDHLVRTHQLAALIESEINMRGTKFGDMWTWLTHYFLPKNLG